MNDTYTIGVDYGTLSGRAVLVRTRDGAQIASAAHPYLHAVITDHLPGLARPLPPEWALQHPQDYLDVLDVTVPALLRGSGVHPDDVVGIGIDFTACTVLPTTASGTPLCFLPRYAAEPHAYVKLWKHHAAQPQADRINAAAAARGEPWLARYGGKISSEWAVAKALQLLEEAPEVYHAAERFIEAADWIVWQLCGAERRNVCTAGYKAIYQGGAYPTREFFAALNPAFAEVADKFAAELHPLGALAGGLTEDAARRTGLRPGIAVAVGNVDAHVTAPAVGATGDGELVAIMGTSTCHVMNSDVLVNVPGMCGVVEGGITPGAYGYEAGQSGVGDIFAWFVAHAVPPRYHDLAEERGQTLHELLTDLGQDQPVGAHGLLALDWLSGNRSVLVNADLSGLILGLTLATRPEDLYRALIEATAFGTRLIIDTFEAAGVPVRDFTAAGGLIRNATLMQLYADVLGRPISVAASSEAPALGSAMHAAVAAGTYPDIHAAAAHMSQVRRHAYQPDPERHRRYTRLYAEYRTVHDLFGRTHPTMITLKRLRDEALAQPQPAARLEVPA
ncbi:ribulokinase [Deinococcus radiotolerans]|uniref:Ribulokinase n=1 Tax=Deinococcus radiotolerans TaxID=1309407 RepID=A0ABQ2FL04_9DEIO|nr:ribulokinase [Deinococcus radiotolerans]GGL08409.1 ribulokinase [Deinococcus radiotolerans]